MDINYDALSAKDIRNLEARVRRRLDKKGYRLTKGRPYTNFPKGLIIHINTNGVAYGRHPFPYNLTLEQVVDFAFDE